MQEGGCVCGQIRRELCRHQDRQVSRGGEGLGEWRVVDEADQPEPGEARAVVELGPVEVGARAFLVVGARLDAAHPGHSCNDVAHGIEMRERAGRRRGSQAESHRACRNLHRRILPPSLASCSIVWSSPHGTRHLTPATMNLNALAEHGLSVAQIGR